MSLSTDPKDIATIRARLGPRLSELLTTMLDVAVSPLFLFSDDRPRLVQARTRAVERLEQWIAEDPEAAGEIYTRLPASVRDRSVPQSLLEAVAWPDYADPLIDLFDYPATDSRVFAAAPDLVPLLDESGLITVTGLDARPWGLHTGEYALHYHQLLRRNYGSTIHYGLIAIILRLAECHHLTARLALDERRLQFREEYREIHESDYWYGPSLRDADLDDPSVVGETFHGDPDGGTSLFHPYAGLAVRWKSDGELKVVEIEEFMPTPDPASEWVFARYLHAIRDTTKHAFVHCDGAVKAFAADGYPRTQHDFKHRGKGDRYRKLFRVDGEFPAAAWSELACSWFRGNRLIAEYMGGAG